MCLGAGVFAGCEGLENNQDGNDSGDNGWTGYTDNVTRIDITSEYDGETFVNARYFFSYGEDGQVSRYTLLSPDNDDAAKRVTERQEFVIGRSNSSMSFAQTYTTVMYDGGQNITDHYYPVENRVETGNINTVSADGSGNIVSVGEAYNDLWDLEERNYSYDADGNLLAMEYPSDSYMSYTMQWENGNVVRYHSGEETGYSGYDVDFTYTDYAAPRLGLFLTMLLVSGDDISDMVEPFVFFTGNSPRNLPSSAVSTSPDDNYRREMNISYGYSDGHVNSMECTVTESDGYSYSYRLDFYYDEQNPDDMEMIPLLESQVLVSDENLSGTEEDGEYVTTKRLTWRNSYSDGTTTEENIEFDVITGMNGWWINQDVSDYDFDLDSLVDVPSPVIEIKDDEIYLDGEEYNVPVEITYNLVNLMDSRRAVAAEARFSFNIETYCEMNGHRRDVSISFRSAGGSYNGYDFMLTVPEFEDFDYSVVPGDINTDIDGETGFITNFSQHFEASLTGTDDTQGFYVFFNRQLE